jgi:hypothetical protein
MNLTTAAFVLTALCGVIALTGAILPVFIPEAAHSPILHEIAKLMLFVFSIGAVAVFYRAFG